MKKTKKLVILALACVLLFGSTLFVHADTVQSTHTHDGECSQEEQILAAGAAGTIYRECGYIYCDTRGYITPFDWCGWCDSVPTLSSYHCRVCKWNPSGAFCGYGGGW